MAGVDPRSPEGQEILAYLDEGFTMDMPEVSELIAAYEGKLIGPQSRKTRANAPTAGPFNNQYGYKAGDEFSELDNLSTEYLARVQDRMAGLGMLDGYVRGRKDPNTVKAFQDLLFMSNAEGTSWTVQLSDLEDQKEAMGHDWAWGDRSGQGGRSPFVAPTYMAPDYATIAQDVKSIMRQTLQRDPDESEMALLTAELSGWDREAFDAEVAARRADYEADAAAADDGATGQGGGTVQSIDPVARFREEFEKRFSGEIRGIRDQEAAAATGEFMRASTANLSAAIRGSGR